MYKLEIESLLEELESESLYRELESEGIYIDELESKGFHKSKAIRDQFPCSSRRVVLVGNREEEALLFIDENNQVSLLRRAGSLSLSVGKLK